MQKIRPTCLSFVYHGSARRNNGMEGNREISVAINRRIKRCCHVLLIHLSLPLVSFALVGKFQECERSV